MKQYINCFALSDVYAARTLVGCIVELCTYTTKLLFTALISASFSFRPFFVRLNDSRYEFFFPRFVPAVFCFVDFFFFLIQRCVLACASYGETYAGLQAGSE